MILFTEFDDTGVVIFNFVAVSVVSINLRGNVSFNGHDLRIKKSFDTNSFQSV